MNKVYSRINNGKGWVDFPSVDTALDAQNLNHMEVGIDETDNRIIILDSTKADASEISELLKDVSIDLQSGIITFTKKNGAIIAIDTPIEKIQTGIYYNPDTEKLVLPLIDGTSIDVDLSRLMQFDEFLDSDTIAFSVNTSGTVTSIVKEGSIKEKHLQPNYLADIKLEVAKAGLSANNAAESATKAESYAHGGTGTREDEDSDNAMEYARQAKISAESAAEIVGGNFIPSSEKGEAGGVAELDESGKVPEEQLPGGIGDVEFESGDELEPESYTTVELIEDNEPRQSFMEKVSTMVKNMRYLFRLMGSEDISTIGNGTVTGALSSLNTDMSSYETLSVSDIQFNTTYVIDVGYKTIYRYGKIIIFTFSVRFKGNTLINDRCITNLPVRCRQARFSINSYAVGSNPLIGILNEDYIEFAGVPTADYEYRCSVVTPEI